VPSNLSHDSDLITSQSFIRPGASRALWSTCSSEHAHNAPFVFSQLLSSLIPIMMCNRMCNVVGPRGSGKTTILQCYAKHVASSHAQVNVSMIASMSPSHLRGNKTSVCTTIDPSFSVCASIPVNLPGSTEFGFWMPKICALSKGAVACLAMCMFVASFAVLLPFLFLT
jgi:hypothetical protein